MTEDKKNGAEQAQEAPTGGGEQAAPTMEMAWSVSGYYAVSDIKEMLDGLGVDMPENKIFWFIQALKVYPTGGNYKQLAGFKDHGAPIVYA